MKRLQEVVVGLAVCALLFASAGGAVSGGEARKSAAQREVAEANNAFAAHLYSKLRERDGNVFFAPQSVFVALAMTYAGARGETADRMGEVLRLRELRTAPVGESVRLSLDGLKADKKKQGYELRVANALWGQKGFGFLPEFLKLLRGDYGAGLRQLDFRASAETARKTINAWVEKETQRKITDLMALGTVDEMTRLVLTNAVYFKGLWAEQFDKKLTRDGPFTLAGGRRIQVPMMRIKKNFAFAETNDLQLLQMAYEGRRLAMVVILPKKTDGIAALDKSLTAEKLGEWLKGLRGGQVRVTLPPFKVTSKFSLADTLKAMGMQVAFTLRADFSGMTGRKDLCISAVEHKAFVDVNEEGTEAAAATGVAMQLTAMAPTKPVVFNADHPFIFLIRDVRTGMILFMGRVMNPKD